MPRFQLTRPSRAVALLFAAWPALAGVAAGVAQAYTGPRVAQAGAAPRAAQAAVDCEKEGQRLGPATNALLLEAAKASDDARAESNPAKYTLSATLYNRAASEARAKHLDSACLSYILSATAVAELASGQYDAAVRDQQAAVDMESPDDPPGERAASYEYLSSALGADKRLDDAIAAGRKALELLGTVPSPDREFAFYVHYALGTLLMRAASYDESAQRYSEAAELEPADSGNGLYARILAGAALRGAGRFAESYRALDAALASAPAGAPASTVRLWRAQFFMQDNRFKDAEQDLGTILDQIPVSDSAGAVLRGSAESMLGGLYLSQNRIADSEKAFDRATEAYGQAPASESQIRLIGMYESQAYVFIRLGRYAEARVAARKAEPLAASAERDANVLLGGSNPVVAEFYTLDGEAALAAHQFGDARTALTKAVAMIRQIVSKGNYLSTALMDLSTADREQGQCEAARSDLAAARASLTAGPSSQLVAELDTNRAVLDYQCDDDAAAASAFGDAFGDVKEQYASTFSLLGERERLAFVGATQTVFDGYFSFGLDRRSTATGSALYDVALFRKNLVARTVVALQARVRQSHDPAVAKTFDDLIATKKELANLADFSTSPDRVARAADLTKHSEALQEQLAERFPDLADALLRGAPHTADVRAALRPGEAAVEIVRFRHFTGHDTTGPPWYVALVLRADHPAPALIDLGPAAAIEGDALVAYRQSGVTPAFRRRPADAAPLAKLVWAPLAPALADIRTVYLAPDGVLNTVSFDALGGGNTRIVLLDTTKDLTSPPPPKAAKTALLFGNPRFDISAADQRDTARELEKSQPAVAGGSLPDPVLDSMRAVGNGRPLPPLAGTEVEIANVAHLLRDHEWQAQTYTGAAALEEVLEHEAHGQRVVHLATHGVFLPDVDAPAPVTALLPAPSGSALESSPDAASSPDASGAPPLPETLVGTPENDPMLRSLLFFAGADRAWAHQELPPAGVDSGVLTAAEAATLDLRGTELVVLSACETGLGSVRSGDGVLGLRRALRQAGARQVLMSLWRLPDTETEELMTSFYAYWLEGQDAHDALRAAQSDERAKLVKRYGSADPYYWAGLVVVGAPSTRP